MKDYEKLPVTISKRGSTFFMAKVIQRLEDLIDKFAKFSVEFPETQKVEVVNPAPVQKVEVINQEKPLQKIDFPAIQPVSVTNQVDIPTGQGNIAGKTDPSRYVPVRLTNGEKYYNALEDAFVSASAKSPQFVDQNGKPTFVQLDSQGRLPTVAGGATVSTTSGSPLFVYNVNEPTTQQVYVVNPSAATVTTSSGSPLFNYITNWPTTQQVYVVNPSTATVTTTSGMPLDVKVGNFPTVQTVNVQNLPSVTSASGTLHSLVDNFPTIQTVDVSNMPVVTSVSGSVVVSQLPAVTSASGTLHALIDNFPTIQTIQGAVTGSMGRTWTLASGTDSTAVSNFPTIQTVNVQNLPSVAVSQLPAVTSTSGTLHSLVDNFPTVQTVNVQTAPANVPSATSDGLTTAFTGSLSNTPWPVKTSAGNFYGYHIYNPNSSVVYIQVFNTTSGTTTVGSTSPSFVLAVPALGALDAMSAPLPVAFSTAITLAATTTFNGSTAPSTPVVTDVFYK